MAGYGSGWVIMARYNIFGCLW